MHRLASLCCLVTFALGCGTSDSQPTALRKLQSADTRPSTEGSTTSSQESLHDLSPDAHQFKQAFNTAKGQVRVVMLVSPG